MENDFEIRVNGELVTKIMINDSIVNSYTEQNEDKRSGMLLNLGDRIFRKSIEIYSKDKN